MRPDPIFLLGPHKSGTSLLRSLFDGAKGHYAIPIETHCFQLLNSWIRYPYRRQFPGTNTRETFLNSAVEWINKSNRNADRYSDSLTKGWFNIEVFKESLGRRLKDADSNKDFITAYFESVYISLHEGKEINEAVRFIEKSVENAEFAIDLSHMYPNAKFIHIIRNPYSNITSLRRYKSEGGYPYIDVIAKTLYESYYFLYKNEKVLSNYKIVKYEDLVLNTEKVVKEICQFADILYNEDLLVPTVQGKKWKGNSISGKRFTGVSAKRLDMWKSEINDLEISIVNRLFVHVLKRFGYRQIQGGKKKYLRCKDESVKNYFINRLFLARAESVV